MTVSAKTLLAAALLLVVAVSAAVGSNPRAAAAAPAVESSSASATSQKAAVAEPGSDDEEQQQQSALLPLHYFPMMQKFQRCLFVCRYCYDSHAVRLLHCANAWCLGRVQKSLRLPARAYSECPAMRLIED